MNNIRKYLNHLTCVICGHRPMCHKNGDVVCDTLVTKLNPPFHTLRVKVCGRCQTMICESVG